MRCYKARCGPINALTPHAFAKNGYSLQHCSIEISVIYPLQGLLTGWGSWLLFAFREEQTCVANTLTAIFRSDNCSWFWSTHAFTLPWVALVRYQGLKETTPLEPRPDWQSRYLICCGYRTDDQKGSWEQAYKFCGHCKDYLKSTKQRDEAKLSKRSLSCLADEYQLFNQHTCLLKKESLKNHVYRDA